MACETSQKLSTLNSLERKMETHQPLWRMGYAGSSNVQAFWTDSDKFVYVALMTEQGPGLR